MKKEDLFEGISGLDEDLLIRSEETPKDTNKRLKCFVEIATTAACFVVLFLAYDLMSDNSGEDGVGVLTPIPIVKESGSVEETGRADSKENLVETTDEIKEIIGEESSSQGVQQKEANSQNIFDLATVKGDGEKTNQESKQFISGYQGTVNPQTESLRKITNGTVYYSEGLQAAMQEYQDTVCYRVVVKVYQDSYELAPDSSEVNFEMERLAAAGYIVAEETYNNGVDVSYFTTLHATSDQLKNFAVNEQYGYYILLYDQVVKTEDDTAYVYPGVNDQHEYYTLPYNGRDGAADEFGEYREATSYPDDIVELQKRVSADMSAGKIPFVISSSIMENPLRLEIRVTTQDNELINQVKAYDPNGIYIKVMQATKEQAIQE